MAKKEPGEDIFAEIVKKIDPMEATIMLLGGTAATHGVVPPFTWLISQLAGGSAISWETFAGMTNEERALAINPVLGIGVRLGYGLEAMQRALEEEQAKATSPQDSKMIGLFCSGCIEAILMYRFASNPEFQRAVLALPGQALGALGKLIPTK